MSLWIILCWACLLCPPPLVQAEIATSSISPDELIEYAAQPPEIQKLIQTALGLTRRKLAYTFGSNSPSRGGMDCSGAVQYTLSQLGITKSPRTAFNFYQWIKTNGKIHPARRIYEASDPAFAALKPGDLLFWEGTYNAAKNNPPVSHVMLYLGKLKKDGKGVMFGSSSGRRFRGKKIHGVSVFDFKLPSKSSKAKFIGYGAIPGLVVTPEKTVTKITKQTKTKKTLLEWLGLKTKKIDSTKKAPTVAEPISQPPATEQTQDTKQKPAPTE